MELPGSQGEHAATCTARLPRHTYTIKSLFSEFVGGASEFSRRVWSAGTFL